LIIIIQKRTTTLFLVLQISGTVEFFYNDVIVNRVYTASKDNEIIITSNVGNGDWIECNWTTTQRKNTTDFKREFPSFKKTHKL
jgi:hypothetical protein